MTMLIRFNPPGGLAEPTSEDAEAWSGEVRRLFEPHLAQFPQFFDPTRTEVPPEATEAQVLWSAFPANLENKLEDQADTEEKRWRLADGSRLLQDEYCEWSVERDVDGGITRVTFTSEVREYWNHMFERDPDRVLALYRDLVSPEVQPEDLLLEQGLYAPGNPWNLSTEGRLAHLVQGSNNLDAAITLAAQATVLRERNGIPVTGNQDLVDCAGLGDPFRNSDPQIAAAVNNVAALGSEVTLRDPLGLYIDGLLTGGMTTPDGENPAAFWTIERGTAGHTLRARFEVPPERGYTVSDIQIEGRPIQFGGQLAERVQVRIAVVIKPGDHQPQRQSCLPRND